MSASFAPRARVRAPKDGNVTGTVLAVHGEYVWIIFDHAKGEAEWPTTYRADDLELAS